MKYLKLTAIMAITALPVQAGLFGSGKINEVKRIVQQNRQDIADLKATNKQLIYESELASATNNELSLQVQDLTDQVSRATATISALKAEISLLKTYQQQLTEQLEYKIEQLDIITNRLVGMEKDLDDLLEEK